MLNVKNDRLDATDFIFWQRWNYLHAIKHDFIIVMYYHDYYHNHKNYYDVNLIYLVIYFSRRH